MLSRIGRAGAPAPRMGRSGPLGLGLDREDVDGNLSVTFYSNLDKLRWSWVLVHGSRKLEPRTRRQNARRWGACETETELKSDLFQNESIRQNIGNREPAQS